MAGFYAKKQKYYNRLYKTKKKKCFHIMQESENWFNEFSGKNWFSNYIL